MQIPVLVELTAANGYRASSGEPLRLCAEGATREDALRKLSLLLESKLVNGTELLFLPLPRTDNPWQRGAGIFADDPQFDEWIAIMEENRRLAAEQEDAP